MSNVNTQKNNYYNDKSFNFGRFFVGLIVILIGFAFLSQNMGWIDLSRINVDWLNLWPVFIIFIGLSMLSCRGRIGTIIGVLFSFLILITILFVIFNPSNNISINSGTIITEKRNIQNINEIELLGLGNLIIQQGDLESLKIEADNNLLLQIKTEINNGKLTIKNEQNWPFQLFTSKKTPDFQITVRDVKKYLFPEQVQLLAKN